MSKYLVIENQDLVLSSIIGDSVSVDYGGQKDDLALDAWLFENITANTFEKIFIQLKLGFEDADTGLRVASHIRLSNFHGTQYLPIYIITQEEKENIISTQVKDNKELTSILLNTKSCRLAKFTELLNLDTFTDTPISDDEELERLVISKLKFDDVFDERHQITNEWGALRLLQNSGYELDSITYEYPRTLYFKSLQKVALKEKLTIDEIKKIQEDNGIDNPLNKVNLYAKLKNKKVLLIDDNATKGWGEVLSKIFGVPNVDVAESIQAISRISDYDSYDIVFLDLYMPNPENGNIRDSVWAIKILESLKTTYPEVPVIIFTASNKSWTLEDVMNKGADGMYVKESPLFISNTDYSKENFKHFLKAVISCLNKYSVLRPYWEQIKIIKNNLLSDINDNNPDAKFKSRIDERLNMFYGLLKNGFEQTDYNKNNFFYSDYELAFMTLWSIMNEIQEAYYEKDQPEILYLLDSVGNSITNHDDYNSRPFTYLNIPNGIKHYRWKIRDQSDVFIKYEYTLESDISNRLGFFRLNGKQQSLFSVQNKNNFNLESTFSNTRVNYENTLYMQIAYLIELKDELLSAQKINKQSRLVYLNEVRNHLYLTHGNDVSSNFYKKNESEKRNDATNYKITPQEDIKKLFELVGFLLTGEDVIVNF